MEEGGQYSEYSVESNPRAYMSMRDYRNQWMSSPYDSAYNHSWGNHTNSSWEPRPPQYSPPKPPYYAPTSQQQPPTPSPVEQAILNLSKQVDNFIEEQRAVTVQANQETDTIESSLNKEFDGFQSEIDQKLDILQESISKLTNQFVHQEEENLEKECLTDTIVGEQAQLQLQEELKEEPAEDPPEELQGAPQLCVEYGPWKKEEETSQMLTEEGNGEEEMEEPHQFTTKATAQPKNNPLLVPPSVDKVYILPTPAAKSKPAAPAPKGKSNPSLHAMQNFKRLVASVHNFDTTSKAQAAAYTAWHSGWFGCRFGFGASEPWHF